jgi:hypothetical protein
MKGKLTAGQVEYVLEHLGHHAGLDPDLRTLLAYGQKPEEDRPSIFFPASEEELELNKVIRIENIPVLYPVELQHASFFSLDRNRLHFHHDLLKSAFHLLSGYEEFTNKERDPYGRFPCAQSLPFRLNVLYKPVVNYYFEIILAGIQEFCERNHMPFRRNSLLDRPILMLSHDVDLINAYDFRETAYKFKQLLGLADSPLSPNGKVRDAFTALVHLLNPLSGKNPFWSFPELTEWELERGFRATYFFLEKDGRYDNSRYRFHHKKIRRLIHELSEKGHEIGIHGTMQSYDDKNAMDRTVEHLRAVSPVPVNGIRQHYLRFKPNHTARLQAEAGLSYDASLGFSEHEGFRNSYCWPYKFFDFDSQRTMDFWEIPLTLMDVTHFHHRNLNFAQSMDSVRTMASEVVRFNGIFSLLWHNSFFDELVFPGITGHYIEILDLLKSMGMEGITGNEIIRKMKGREPQRD